MAKTQRTYDAHTWFRKNGVPLVVPAQQRLLETVPRSAPLFAWLSISALAHALLWPLIADIATNATDQDIAGVEISEGTYIMVSLTTIVVVPLPLLVVPWLLSRWLKKQTTGRRWITALVMLGLAVFVFSPALSDLLGIPESMFFETNWGTCSFIVGLLLAVFFGLDILIRFELKQTYYELWSLTPMIAKALPTLMIAVLFIFFNADVWKVANKLTYQRTFEVVAVLLVLAVLVSITTILEKTRHMLGGRTGDELEQYSADEYATAAEKSGGFWLTELANGRTPTSRPFRMGEWLNFIVIPIGAQVIQAVMFSTLVAAFFLWFGTLAIPADTVVNWLGETPQNYQIAGITLPFTTVLLKVSLLLGGFAGLNFVATTSSDERYARDFLGENLEELQRVVMMRNVYLRDRA